MNLLRIVLSGLAVVVLVTLGWHLRTTLRSPVQPPLVAVPVPAPEPAPSASAPEPVAPAPEIAAATPPAVAPQVPAPVPAVPPVSPEAPAASAPSEPPPSQPGMTAQEAQAKVVAILAQAPELERAFDVLKAQFPAVAERSLAEATEAFRASGAPPTPDDLFADAMLDLRQSAGVLAAKAGTDALGAIFEAKAAVLAELEQADPRICADYLYGSTSPEFADFEVAHRGLVAQTALTTIAAMVDGRSRQVKRNEPSPEDFKAIEVALGRKGLSTDEVAALLDGRTPDNPPSDARLCDNARTYLDVVKAMPPDARDRVYGLTAELLARS